MFQEKVCFAIDNNTDTHIVAKFLRLMDTRRALGDLHGEVVQCIGMWSDDDGKQYLEPSYMMDARDYYEYVEPSGYVDSQECVLRVPGDTRQPCSLDFKDGSTIGLTPMKEIRGPVFAFDWTYVIATGKYFTC